MSVTCDQASLYFRGGKVRLIQLLGYLSVASPESGLFSDWLRGEKLNYSSYTSLLLRKSQNLLFLAAEVQWALKVYRVCSIHVSFKMFRTMPIFGMSRDYNRKRVKTRTEWIVFEI